MGQTECVYQRRVSPNGKSIASLPDIFKSVPFRAGLPGIAGTSETDAGCRAGPNKWFGNVELLVAQSVGPVTVQYVSNIYKYYVAYKFVVDQGQSFVITGNERPVNSVCQLRARLPQRRLSGTMVYPRSLQPSACLAKKVRGRVVCPTLIDESFS